MEPYEDWGKMEYNKKYGSRDFLLQWELGQKHPIFFELSDKKGYLLRILHSSSEYVGEFGVEYLHYREVVAFFG